MCIHIRVVRFRLEPIQTAPCGTHHQTNSSYRRRREGRWRWRGAAIARAKNSPGSSTGRLRPKACVGPLKGGRGCPRDELPNR